MKRRLSEHVPRPHPWEDTAGAPVGSCAEPTRVARGLKDVLSAGAESCVSASPPVPLRRVASVRTQPDTGGLEGLRESSVLNVRVSCKMSEPGAIACPVREQLELQFQRRLDEYHRVFLALLENMTVDRANEQATGLYRSCVAARQNVRDHEREHRCCKGLRVHQ